ncbi:hypothetical protein K437DRAFT_277632 [Tilletiaria anomala UBC 951]|uniref:Sorting nexin-4 n=1 Tax=Tilletiaria anomala (strain ATCC 24038 / CBS 436.72 / UBC 951) TaxID=1037660 RepID=A0A066WEL9_TILAU|nr:uncharacterized protein K437DRAFT_277632 [Tilletiaria anomala UBC 951]KDN52362.1 hypothetical protein K437DRAFT_277632 [Tilletiaria anomala UBC 951]
MADGNEEHQYTSIHWDAGEPSTSALGGAGFGDAEAGPSASSATAAGPSHDRSASNTRSAGLEAYSPAMMRLSAQDRPELPKWQGFLMVQVCDARKEGEGTKDMFISYGIRAETNLPHFDRTRLTNRRRYKDFAFLRDALTKDFPACVVPPLPDKHRLEYLTGDRFSAEFVERRTADLQLFLERVCRHSILQRTAILRSFLESTEWNVDMHTHMSQSHATTSPNGEAMSSGLLESLSDTLLNAFTKVRKPDAKFVEMRERLEKFEESLASTERILVRNRNRTSAAPSASYSTLAPDPYAPQLDLAPDKDLAIDYEDLAASIDGLGMLESGMTDQLHRFAVTLAEFSRLHKQDASRCSDSILASMHALLTYANAHKQVLKLRDQKQLDFEELTEYLSGVVAERDRLASLSSPQGAGHGHGGVRGAGITGYLKDQMDSLRGIDEERTRVERMQRLDGRIKELQDAVATSHDVSQAFSQQVTVEAMMFEYAKQLELKEMLGQYVDSKVELHSQAVHNWDRLLRSLEAL